MKILFIFCDMLRANLLKTFNNNIKGKGLMDNWFERLGGTSFTNCYTPAPDSARSLACLYTGKYPKNNGCLKRLHWPKYYLRDDLFTLFDLFNKYNYSMLFNITETREKVGSLPKKCYKNMKVFYDLDGVLDKLENVIGKNKNVFSYISLSDYHWAMDDYGHNSMGDYYGQKHLSNCFEKIFRRIEPDLFDYIFIFSDHGFKLSEQLKREKKIYLINDDRSKIVMFIRKKGCNGIRKVSGLSSIIDVLPTLVNIIDNEISYSFDGIPLFREFPDRYLVIEDHSIFEPNLDIIHDLWGIRTNAHFYLSSLSDSVLLNVIGDNEYKKEETPGSSLIAEFQAKISHMTCSYNENMRLYKILKGYKEMTAHIDTYSDGQKRADENNFFFKLKRKLFRNRYKRW